MESNTDVCSGTRLSGSWEDDVLQAWLVWFYLQCLPQLGTLSLSL